MRIRSWDTNLCLQGCNTHNCTSITVAACADSDAQRWIYDASDRLRPLIAGKLCLNAGGGSLVRMVTCQQSAACGWTVSGDNGCHKDCG
jgi:hypothetical protein